MEEIITKEIMFEGINEVQEFAEIIQKYSDTEVELKTGKYSVDAKSIMGIFTFDLTSPITLVIHESPSCEQLLENISKFLR